MRIIKHTILFSVMIIFALLVSSCATSEAVVEEIPATATAEPTATLTSTPEPTSTPLPTYDLNLQILMPGEADGETLPVPNAMVKVNNDPMTTDENGKIVFEALTEDTLELTLWAQGYLPADISIPLQPGVNESTVQLETDPFALQVEALEGYEIVYVEDFQDGEPDFIETQGNFGVFEDETNPGNYLLEADLRNLTDSFYGSFGEAGISNFIVQGRFRYPEIEYYDFSKDHHNWQGYGFSYRDKYAVEGYPLQVEWGPTLQIRDASDPDNWQFPVTVPQYINEGNWYTLKVVIDGPIVETYINGMRRFRYLQAPEPEHQDNVSVYAFAKAWIQYDDIVLWVPVE